MIVTANENYINVIMNLSAEDPFAVSYTHLTLPTIA